MTFEKKVRVETSYGVKIFHSFHFQKHPPTTWKHAQKKISKNEFLQKQQQQQQPSPILNPCDIAILFDSTSLQQPVAFMLLNQRQIYTQRMEKFIVSGCADDVIVDEVDNVMSFESACVIYVREKNSWGHVGTNHFYNLCSRARTCLCVIDVVVDKPPFVTSNVNFVQWKVDKNNKFQRTKPSKKLGTANIAS